MDASKQHAKEVEVGFEAFRDGVAKCKGIHVIVGDIIRAVDAVRKDESTKDRDESFHSA